MAAWSQAARLNPGISEYLRRTAASMDVRWCYSEGCKPIRLRPAGRNRKRCSGF